MFVVNANSALHSFHGFPSSSSNFEPFGYLPISIVALIMHMVDTLVLVEKIDCIHDSLRDRE